jgi:hypothetical protein
MIAQDRNSRQTRASPVRGGPLLCAYCTIVMLEVLLILMVFFLINGMMSG